MENLSMADFISPFWSWFVTIGTIISIAFCFWLIWWMTSGNAIEKTGSGKADDPTTGHQWDDTLREFNNPLPSWWLGMFYLTLFFSLIYLAIYPGLGSYAGMLGWSSRGQHQKEVDKADASFGQLYAQYQAMPVADLAKDAEALKIGERLYLNYCTVCHGSDARGAPGFPNLRDNDWLYGSTPEAIEASILHGRKANGMIAWKETLGGDAGVKDVAQYVISLSGKQHDTEAAARGKEKFMVCTGCHGPDGKGSWLTMKVDSIGAPNLTDDIWLYGMSQLEHSIANGRQGVMPAHKDFLGEAKSHLLAAYIYSLSAGSEVAQAAPAAVAPATEAAPAVAPPQ